MDTQQTKLLSICKCNTTLVHFIKSIITHFIKSIIVFLFVDGQLFWAAKYHFFFGVVLSI